MEASSEEIGQVAFKDGLKDVAYGSVAGVVSKVFEHPFDLCKVRLQSQVLDQSARFSGPIDCLKTTWRKEGIRGLYRGLPMPVIGAMAENATLFLTYGQLQHFYRWIAFGTKSGKSSCDTTPTELAFAAAGAGAATSFLLTPIELIKCKMQVQMLAVESSLSSSSSSSAANPKPKYPKLPGPVQLFRSVLKQHGIKGLWLGQTGTLIRESGGAVAWFGTKEAISTGLYNYRERGLNQSDADTFAEGKGKGKKKELYAWESAVSGAFAGVAYNVVLFPADSVKSALQTAEELRPNSSNGGERPTFWGTAKEMYRSKGVRGLYAGLGVTTARAIPSSAMIFLIYDGLSKRFG